MHYYYGLILINNTINFLSFKFNSRPKKSIISNIIKIKINRYQGNNP